MSGKWFLVCLALVLSACGSKDSEPAKQPSTSEKPAASAENTGAKAKVDHEQFAQTNWKWPADKGPERDLVADDERCRKAGPPDAKPMHKLAFYTKCMLEHGWQFKAE
jgi:hypothetical protein